MASLKTKFTVGVFVVIGLALFIVAIVWLGMSHYFEKGRLYAAYFDESVQGLDKDSPVKYRGVSIGRVHHIGVAPDANLIQVILKIESELEVHKGIVAQLKSVGITGIMFVELDHRTEDEPDFNPAISFPTEYPVIATKPSGVKQLLEGLSDIIDQFKGLDSKGLALKVQSTLDALQQTIEDAQVGTLMADLRRSLHKTEALLDSMDLGGMVASITQTSAAYRQLAESTSKTVRRAGSTVDRVDDLVRINTATLNHAVSELNSAMAQANLFFERGTRLVETSETGVRRFEHQILRTLQNLHTATNNLNRFLVVIADHPSQLLLSEPRPARDSSTGR